MRENDLHREIDALQQELSGLAGRTDQGAVERRENLKRGIDARTDELRTLTGQRAAVRSAASNPANIEAGTGFTEDDEQARGTRSRFRRPIDEARDAAHRAIERSCRGMRTDAGDRLVELVERDQVGADARYITAVSDPAYARAFAKKLAMPEGASQAVEPDEGEAMLMVGRAMAERSMLAGTGSAGGFALPIEIDPTINLDNDGQINPLRQIARVRSTTSYELRLITSAGTTASFGAEASQVDDGTPTLAQPVATPQRATCFVPFSFEVGMDWPGMAAELGRIMADAKDVLEAEKFLHGAGSGSDEPAGLIATLDSGSIIDTDQGGSTPGLIAADDVYLVQESLPARWSGRAVWMSGLPIANTIHRFSGPGGDEPPLFDEARGRLLGKPWWEASNMAGDHEDDGLLLYGDIGAAFQIVDRIGMSIELVPHLFGADRRPTGERGLVACWRTTSIVVVPEAVRLLVAGTS
ncbi:MAG: phage major capsid protein [Miltoncostaeaceae bacterium]